MRFYFHPQANEELDRAVRFYEECQPGLGLDFAEEVYAAIERISKFPEAGSIVSQNTRRGLVHRYPYGLIYQVKSGCLRIVAVAELHRRPAYWRGRARLPSRQHS